MALERSLTVRDHALLTDRQRELPDTRTSQQFLHNATLRLVGQFTGQNIEPNLIPEVVSDSPEATPETLGTWNDMDSQSLVSGAPFQNADLPKILTDTLPMLPDEDSQTNSFVQADEFPLAPSVAFANLETPPISFDALPTALSSESLAALSDSDIKSTDFASELPSALPTSLMPPWSPGASTASFISFDSPPATSASPDFVGFEFLSGDSPFVDQSSSLDRGVKPPNISSPLVTVNDFGNSGSLAASGDLPVSVELVTMQTKTLIAEAVEKATSLAEQVVEGHIDEERAIALAKESQRRACLRR